MQLSCDERERPREDDQALAAVVLDPRADQGHQVVGRENGAQRSLLINHLLAGLKQMLRTPACEYQVVPVLLLQHRRNARRRRNRRSCRPLSTLQMLAPSRARSV